jgi:hypothetical protein
VRFAPLILQLSPHMGGGINSGEAQLEYRYRHSLSIVARFSLGLSFAHLLLILLNPLTFHDSCVISRRNAVTGLAILALVTLVLIMWARTTGGLWRWGSA